MVLKFYLKILFLQLTESFDSELFNCKVCKHNNIQRRWAMTQNQIRFKESEETRRHNLETEKELARNNRAVIAETSRHNLATESEAYRSNTLQHQDRELANTINQQHLERQDAENFRANTAREAENYRHNLAAEYVDRLNAASNAQMAQASMRQSDAALANAATNRWSAERQISLGNRNADIQEGHYIDQANRWNIQNLNELRTIPSSIQVNQTRADLQTQQAISSKWGRRTDVADTINKFFQTGAQYLNAASNLVGGLR